MSGGTPGISFGLTPGGIWSPSTLYQNLRSCLGSSLTALWVGEDIVDDGNGNVTSWPSRGGPVAVNSTVDLFQVAMLNGRKAMTSSTLVLRSLSGTLALAPVCVFAVAIMPALPFAQLSTIFRTTTQSVITGNPGSSQISTTSAWSHYIDGILTQNVTAGAHIIQANKAGATETAFLIGGHASQSTRVWIAPIAGIVALSALPSVEQRTYVTAAMKKYWMIGS